MIKPTHKQKKAFNIYMNKIKDKKPVVMREILEEADYGHRVTHNPALVTNTVGWEQLMAKIDDGAIVEKVVEIATDSKDKRSCLAAADMVFKLKDRYPQKNSKLVGLFANVPNDET